MREIMKMIETVSPDDAVKLDEIDARVWCCIQKHQFIAITPRGVKYYGKDLEPTTLVTPVIGPECGVTRSRDALKAIRPEGWRLEIQHVPSLSKAGETKWYSSLISQCGNYEVNCGPLPTEELAELHAILQALEHERTK